MAQPTAVCSVCAFQDQTGARRAGYLDPRAPFLAFQRLPVAKCPQPLTSRRSQLWRLRHVTEVTARQYVKLQVWMMPYQRGPPSKVIGPVFADDPSRWN